MQRFKHFLVIACDILVLMGTAGLILPPAIYGKNGPFPPVEGSPMDHPGQGDEHRADPCDHLPDPPGKAKGIDRRCPRGGSSSGIARGDFNGDGSADLAIGIPGENIGSADDVGAVTVIYGSSGSGLIVPTTAGGTPASQLWSQNTEGVQDTSEDNDRFGSALAAGDFNDDGFSDLAIGVPGEKLVRSGVGFSGMIVTIYGSANGLTTDPNSGVPGSQSFSLEHVNDDQLVLFAAETEDEVSDQFFGSSLAWGDFNGDGVGDLAVGAPEATIDVVGSSFASVGAVGTLFGSRDGGLSTAGGHLSTDISGAGGDSYGEALAAGDFNRDGNTDLAIGIPKSDSDSSLNAGKVRVLLGQSDVGFGVARIITQESFPTVISGGTIPDGIVDPEDNDRFGSALAAGDFNGDGFADLAIGVPLKNVNGLTNSGGVFISYGSNSMVPIAPGFSSQFWDQNTIFGPNINPLTESATEAQDQFGFALAAGDFNADGRADLAVGVPFEDVVVDRGTFLETVTNAGEVDVIYGSASGLSITGRAPQQWHQNTINIEDNAETNDLFGFSLTAWNFGRNENAQSGNVVLLGFFKLADLAIGVPAENLGSIADAGAVNVLYGRTATNGLSSTNDQFWHQDSPGVPGSAEAGDVFGRTLY